MPHLTMRLIATRTDTEHIITALCGVEGVERVRWVDDLLPQMGEESAATMARPADLHPALRSIEIDMADTSQCQAARQAAAQAAHARGITPEFVDDPQPL